MADWVGELLASLSSSVVWYWCQLLGSVLKSFKYLLTLQSSGHYTMSECLSLLLGNVRIPVYNCSDRYSLLLHVSAFYTHVSKSHSL